VGTLAGDNTLTSRYKMPNNIDQRFKSIIIKITNTRGEGVVSKFTQKGLILALLIIMAACKSGAMVEVEDSVSSNSSSSNTSSSSTLVNTSTTTTPTASTNSYVEVISTAETLSTSETITQYSVESGEFNLLPREINGWDKNGWSVLTPSDDSRLIYVNSFSGNDETAEFYAPRDIADLKNPGLIKPFKTVEAAIENTRQGFPDWVLLNRDDKWELTPRTAIKGGRSITERSVLTSYGDAGGRPMLSNQGKDILRIWANKNYIAITGIYFHSPERDPESNVFAGWGNISEQNGLVIYGPEGTTMGSILLEDNHFNYLSKGISIIGNGDHRDIVIRRNIIRNSYNDLGHSQGMSAAKTSALLEENIFDHNGWYIQQRDKDGRDNDEGQGTIYNHNTYFTKAVDTIFRNNIFLRPSSIHNKWTANPPGGGVDHVMSQNLVMENNLYVGGEVGISAGGNDDYNTGPRWKNIKIIDNIMLAIGRDQPTNRNLGWYIDTVDWDGGEVCGNYLLNNDNELVQNINAIKVNGHSNDLTVSKNLIYGLKMTNSSAKNGGITIDDAPKSNINVRDNNIQLSGSKMLPVIVESGDVSMFESNTYFTDSDPEEWFSADGVTYSYENWLLLASETGSSNEQQVFLAPERNFETYLSSIGIEPNVDSFIDSLLDLPAHTWDERFSAEKINTYIREGYGNTTCN
jgi:hypothetical protein